MHDIIVNHKVSNKYTARSFHFGQIKNKHGFVKLQMPTDNLDIV